MLCPKCGSPITDDIKNCPICGNELNASDLDATVMATEPDATVRAAALVVQSAQAEEVQLQPVEPEQTQQYSYAPAAATQPPKKNGTGLKIGIAVASVIAVVAVVFAVLLGTGTISINKKEEETTVSSKIDKPATKKTEAEEPKIGSISDLPVVTGDKSIEKAMLKIKESDKDGVPAYIGFDRTDFSNPVIHMGMVVNTEYGEITVHYAGLSEYTYYKSEGFMQNQTIKQEDDNSDAGDTLVYFGQYDSLIKEKNVKFKYLGKEKLAIGDTYIYEYIVDGKENGRKIWVEAETGFIVKMEDDGTVNLEVTEILIGDDADLPEFDYENAIVLDDEPEIGTVSDLPAVTGDESVGKAMLKLKTTDGDEGAFKITYVAIDFTNDLQPLYIGSQKVDDELGTVIMHQAYFEDYIYYTTNLYEVGKTFKTPNEVDVDEGKLYFGLYNEDFLKENNLKFKYLGKEELATGSAYIYEVGNEKVWIDVDTGYWVKIEGGFEVSEIITGDDVELPNIDFANAVASE